LFELDHIGIAVDDLEKAVMRYCLLLDVDPATVEIEEIPVEGLRIASLKGKDARIELMTPTTNTSTIAKFIAKRGCGLHHVCFAADELGKRLTLLADAGFKLIDEAPRDVRGETIAFVHPSSTFGVLTEFREI